MAPRICQVLLLLPLLAFGTAEIQHIELQTLVDQELSALEVNFECNRGQKVEDVLPAITEEQYNQAALCLLQSLTKSWKKSATWALLGFIYGKLGKLDLQKQFYAKASHFVQQSTIEIKQWHFIGPFQIGKGEFDGDPVEAFGGIHIAAKQRFSKVTKYFSELTPNGEVGWMKVLTAEGGVSIRPDINWSDVVRSLSSMGATEWQGWAVGTFVVNKQHNFVVQCLGVSHFYIDDLLFPGDFYRRDHIWLPVQLSPGLHIVYVKIRANASVQFKFVLKLKDSDYFIAHLPNFSPDLYEGELAGNYIALPLSNLHPSKWANDIKVKTIIQSDKKFATDIVGRRPLAPGQTDFLNLKISEESKKSKKKCRDVLLKITVSSSLGESSVGDISLRCRNNGQSFILTFLDHDGSVQHAAAIAPLKKCKDGTANAILTLHGTSIPAQNQADAYKHMIDGKYVFGVQNYWVVAPTRHGAHNWEGPGMLTARMALRALADLTQNKSSFKCVLNSLNAVIAGHSMGGHGAWVLSTHFPDETIAVMSLAGWITKESYGDSNLFFRHDIASSHVDAATKAILEACFADNDVDKLITNIQHKPVVIRIGSNDRTVHPYYSRRMYRLLKEQGTEVTLVELPEKEHWWWDTWDTNDGGVVNDPKLRQFFADQLPTNSLDSCDINVVDSCQEDTENKYSSANGNFVKNFTLTLMNPASFGSMEGTVVDQQEIVLRKSRIRVSVWGRLAYVTTENVKAFHVESAGRNIWNGVNVMFVDNVEFQFDTLPASLIFCKKDNHWKLSNDKCLQQERSSHQYGPARRITELPFVIIVGTKNNYVPLLRYAVFLANLFFLTSDTSVPIINDVDMNESELESRNVILIGNISENIFMERFLRLLPLKGTVSGMALNQCSYTNLEIGVLSLAPNGKKYLALLIFGSSLHGLEDVIKLSLPTIPPMARSPFSNMIPDFIISGPEARLRGAGGLICSGFWGNHWEYRTDSSSCVC